MDKSTVPLSLVPRTAPSEGKVRSTSSLSMVDRRADEPAGDDELRLGALGPLSFGISDDNVHCWHRRGSDISLGRCTVRIDRYWHKSDKIGRSDRAGLRAILGKSK